MLLQLNQRNDLIFALGQDFNPLTFESMLLTRLNRRLHDIIITAGTNYTVVVETVVGRAEQEGWIWTLIEGALANNPDGPYLKQFTMQHPDFDPAKGPPAIVDYVLAHTLRARRYFIDRKPLRDALKEMRSADGPRVLVVTGDRRSGKTYTLELITFLSEKTPKHKAVYVDLDVYVYEAPNLTEAIGHQLGMDTLNIPKQEDEQKARWVQRLCGWIIERIVNPGDVTYWFIFDGFREHTLLPETRDWIEQLAVQVETNVPNCRVVLLNYNDRLPIRIDAYVSREKITRIGHDELLDFFQQLNRDHKKNYAEAELKSKVEVILAQVDEAIAGKPENESERLPLLSKAVNATAKILFV